MGGDAQPQVLSQLLVWWRRGDELQPIEEPGHLLLAGQVITQLTADDAPVGEPGTAGPAQWGFGLLAAQLAGIDVPLPGDPVPEPRRGRW
jgi:hypothetical protein